MLSPFGQGDQTSIGYQPNQKNLNAIDNTMSSVMPVDYSVQYGLIEPAYGTRRDDNEPSTSAPGLIV
jgi:hypothetical protein